MTTEFGRSDNTAETLTNWPGQSARFWLGKIAFSVIVPVCGSMALSTNDSVPLAIVAPPFGGTALTTIFDAPAARSGASCASGMLKAT